MKSVIDQLDRESLLVMYLAGELSAEDRRRVDAMIAKDDSLRAEIDSLHDVQTMVDEGLAAADHAQLLPVGTSGIERRVGRMIREWQVDRPATPPTVVQKVVGLKYPWWAYPMTAAAAVFLAFLVWWGNTPMRPYNSPVPDNTQVAQDDSATTEPSEDVRLAEELERSFTHPSHEGIRQAEGELYALSTSDETDEVLQQDVNQ